MVVLVLQHSLSTDDVPGDVHFRVHEAPLLQGDVVVQVRFDRRSFLGHDFGFDGGDFLHGHGFGQRPDLVGLYDAFLVSLQAGGKTLLVQTHSFFILHSWLFCF
uniref:Uncharacterized protein n=1 Tax=Anguilla anguilla TaxID=7936 RepID=A0A0E9QN36_ANGAN